MQTQSTVAPSARPEFMVFPLTATERGFVKFHAKNPHVYAALVDLALRGHRAGLKKFGINSLIETLRYSAALQTAGDSYAINNSYAPLYARLLVGNHPELRGMIELRFRPSAPQYREQ